MSQEGFDRLKRECINSGLCVECGACELVCPNQAIELKKYSWGRNPELVKSCVDQKCDLCYKACAAAKVPLTQIETKYFGRTRSHLFPGVSKEYPNEHGEAKCGIWRNVYTGYALDEEIHQSAVSGGVATAILVHALETGMIDGAILAGFDPETPYEAKAFVATTREEILQCAGSKYQPHPQLLGIREAIKMGLERLAITTTPCNALSLRKMMIQKEFDDITKRMKLVLSNICGAHWSRHGTEFLIKDRMKLKLQDIAAIKYRARPFPGEFKVSLKDGANADAPFVNRLLGELAKFTPEECRYCLEKVGSVADIVVGDTWHHPVLCPRLLGTYTEEDCAKDERIAYARNGMTAVVVRSELGQSFVDSALKSGAIRLFQDTPEDAQKFLEGVYDEGKPICNGPVIEARIRRGQPLREYF